MFFFILSLSSLSLETPLHSPALLCYRSACVQTVINAGNQVNEALADCQAAREKDGYYKRQIEVLQDAYTGTHELMDNGKASYLEVLSAQEGLLSAQISEATNLYNGSRALIALYIALGGGTK